MGTTRQPKGDRVTQLDGASAAPPAAPEARPVAIRADGVERVFPTKRGGVHALGPVDLTVHDGEFVCIVGPSGCGKSTFMRIVAGLMRPSAGRLEVRQRAGHPDAAVVFQNYSIFPWKSVVANIRLGIELSGLSRKEATAIAEHWAAELGLADFMSAYPGTLSGGMQQRVAIARALALDPSILLMDEPFAALDAQLREVLQDQLLGVWQADHRTVLFITHSLEEAALLADRVLVMSNRPGRLLADRTVPFDRPRTGALRNSSEFGAFRQELWELLRGEVHDT
jgi:NitT/TauT family transport system ATP-binding protein